MRPLVRAAYATLVAATLFLLAGPARAETVRLEYVVDSGLHACPDEARLRALIEARLGYAPIRDDATSTVRATVTLRRGVLSGRVQLNDGSGAMRGARSLDAQPGECGELVAAMALAIAVALDPVRALAEHPKDTVAPPLAPIAPAPAPIAPTPAPPPPTPQRARPALANVRPVSASVRTEAGPRDPPPPPTSLLLSAGVMSTLGRAPAPGLAGSLSLGVSRRAWRLELEGHLDAGVTREARRGHAELSQWSTALLACALARPAFGCLLVEAGSVNARGVGVDLPQATSALHAATGVRGGVDVHVWGPLRLRAYVEAGVRLTRPRLLLDEVEIWVAPPVTTAAGVQIVTQFF